MTSWTSTSTSTVCEVHPLVLLIIPLSLYFLTKHATADHHARAAKGSKKRVVGCLLGQDNGNVINVANSFAVPFEEDEKDPKTWFLDHDFIEGMMEMFKKVNAREKLIGFYHTGPSLRASDLEINELFKRWSNRPVMVVINVGNSDDLNKDEGEIPAEAYVQVEEVREDGSPPAKTFLHIPSQIVAEEAEEIGVEHLLRDVRPTNTTNANISLLGGETLTTRVGALLGALRGLTNRLSTISKYLDDVQSGKLRTNHAILYDLQEIVTLLPSGAEDSTEEMLTAVSREGNDSHVVLYLSSLIRAVVKLHDLVDNKLSNSRAELGLPEPTKEKKEEKSDEDKKTETEKK
ncbi:hypothetical protein E3Q23_00281 [Wallemia mellicola]|uniref:Mov34-domain-containing protein n=1 Tax=Wallemia mellicola TaxID=1708541 RepID=A0AB38MZB3_9BASI|nr:hypothetical protein E3Q23_00281 [Wallemia mellicola]TIB87387.1 Mov34-domain-containing protein [Wallemia mellicola]TIB90353.1 Mov34-domain-containing protein [Wallemia mellicola]TIC06325.1 Mov34-domain-containing protein [Wallemia mellicola]TIC24606.1 Mov34-domain-containing protein [Wallemia mellicola]